MDRTTVTKIIAALAAGTALVALGALLPKPDPVVPVVGQASLAPDSINPVVGQASLAPDSINPVVGQASLAPSDRGGILHVYVCGAVHKPGVYALPAGMRVVDAIAQAGGAVENGDLEQLNLAEPLADSMKVDVPVKGRQLSSSTVSRDDARAGSSSSGGSGRSGRHHSTRGGSHKLSAGQTIDINTASESELVQLPGVGPSLARRIVEYRAANGPFQIPDDLQNVSGIGPTKYAKMEPFVRV
jgi:competence protein ComEA